MSLLIGIHGKIGSGKNTAATLLKDIIHSTKPLEERSFAYALKKIVAVFTNTSIETQMTEQGKNTSILFSSIIGGSTECDTDKLVDHLMTYKYFSEIKLPFPSQPEQQKIATYLTAIDTKIENTSQQINQMQSFKKGLLQQLFV